MRVTVRRAEGLDPGMARVIRRASLAALLRGCGDRLGVGNRSLAVLLADDAELHHLNRTFLGVDAPTDVLAFPADDSAHVGDIAMSVERAVAQGAVRDLDGVAELRLLAVHGLLHCLGYDHGSVADAAAMTEATRRLLPDADVPALLPVEHTSR